MSYFKAVIAEPLELNVSPPIIEAASQLPGYPYPGTRVSESKRRGRNSSEPGSTSHGLVYPGYLGIPTAGKSMFASITIKIGA
eukprot:3354664-Rhodomonas_salina.1